MEIIVTPREDKPTQATTACSPNCEMDCVHCDESSAAATKHLDPLAP